MISVCLAAYNGSRWITQQLESILPQLGPADEVIVVDDASSDKTVETVSALGDDRIAVHRNPTNSGVNASFERALSLARGDIIFLSDQDDLWHPRKVARVLEVFDTSPETTLVLSDARVVDAAGAVIRPSYFGDRGPFIPGVLPNILKSKFLGCAIAFRRSIRDRSLPFPAEIPGHDMWIGIVNELFGRTCFIEDPLIDYRRHGSNASPSTRQKLGTMLIWRWQLVRNIVPLAIAKWLGRAGER